MFNNDMRIKMRKAKDRVKRAIDSDSGCTLLATGICGDDGRLALAAVQAGAKLLEPNHPAVALARGHRGVSNMHDAEQVRHEIPLQEMAKITRGVRNVVGPDVYITVGIPGGFTEILPISLNEEDFCTMSNAGADGLHVHKSDIKDLEALTALAHKYGLLVDAYIGSSTDRHVFGLTADSPADVARVAKNMESAGVDFIGIMTGMSYEGVAADAIPQAIIERLNALTGAVKVPTLAEGGINTANVKAFRSTGVNILVVGTSFDDVVRKAVGDMVRMYLP